MKSILQWILLCLSMALFSPHVQAQAFKVVPQDLDPSKADAILLKGGLGKVTVGYNEFKSEKLPYGQGYKMVVKNPSATTKVRIGPLHPAFDRPSTTESKLEAGKEYFYIYGASSRSSPLAVTKEEANFFINMNSWMKSNQYTEVTF